MSTAQAASRRRKEPPSAETLADVADAAGGATTDHSGAKAGGKKGASAKKSGGDGAALNPLFQDSKKKASDIRARLLGTGKTGGDGKSKPDAGGKTKAAKEQEDLDTLQQRLGGGKKGASVDDDLDDELAGEPESDADDDEESDEADDRAASRGRDRQRRAEDDGEADDELDDETLDLAEESGWTSREAREMAAEVGAAAFKRLLRRMGRRAAVDDEDERDERRGRRGRREEEVDDEDDVADDTNHEARADDKSGTATKKPLFPEFAVDPEWGPETKAVMEPFTAKVNEFVKSVSEYVGKLEDRVEKLDGRFGASERSRQLEAAARAQKQIDALFADAVKANPTLADVFGRIATAKLPANSPLRKQRQELIDEMTEIQHLRRRRGRELLELPDLFQRAIDMLHPEQVEERTRNKVTSEIRRNKGGAVMRANGRRSAADALPQGREKAIATAERKAEQLFG